LNYLARRDHSKFELLQKCKNKKYPIDDIHTALNALTHSGFINEQRFTQNYIDSRRRKGMGPKRIFIELEARGIATDMIAEELKITDNVWLDDVQRVWRKQFKNQLPEDSRSRLKQMRFLQYRGFTREQIEHVYIKVY
jgi:regulatory protein